jgi:hypothetical protein
MVSASGKVVGDPSLDGCGARTAGKSRDRTLFQIYYILE